jgi:hypothetical protein
LKHDRFHWIGPSPSMRQFVVGLMAVALHRHLHHGFVLPRGFERRDPRLAARIRFKRVNDMS